MIARARRAFLLMGVILALLACARLPVLLKGSGAGPTGVAASRLDTEIRLTVQGASGQIIRLHLPEIPLNLDVPFSEGEVTVPVSLAVARRPRTLWVQVVRGGKVVASSPSLRLGEGAQVELGRVEVQPP